MVLAFSSSCAYRFTNDHIVRPEGIRTIAVEAIYDTSREVLPHEILWESLQSAFATSGHLRLAPQKQADAIVRAHLKSAHIGSSGTISTNGPVRDPATRDHEPPPNPGDFRPLTQAGEVRDGGTLSTVVEVEVWNLRTRTLLLRQTYNSSVAFRTVRSLAGDTSVTVPANEYLRYQEAVDARFKQIAGDIANQVVRDLLVR